MCAIFAFRCWAWALNEDFNQRFQWFWWSFSNFSLDTHIYIKALTCSDSFWGVRVNFYRVCWTVHFAKKEQTESAKKRAIYLSSLFIKPNTNKQFINWECECVCICVWIKVHLTSFFCLLDSNILNGLTPSDRAVASSYHHQFEAYRYFFFKKIEKKGKSYQFYFTCVYEYGYELCIVK